MIALAGAPDSIAAVIVLLIGGIIIILVGLKVAFDLRLLDAVDDGRVRFYPSRYAKTYTDWLKEKRDWCISRQLWWGHRIPACAGTRPTAACPISIST